MTEMPPTPETTEADLIAILTAILIKSDIKGDKQETIIKEIVPYIAEREQKMINHAFSAGRASA